MQRSEAFDILDVKNKAISKYPPAWSLRREKIRKQKPWPLAVCTAGKLQWNDIYWYCFNVKSQTAWGPKSCRTPPMDSSNSMTCSVCVSHLLITFKLVQMHMSLKKLLEILTQSLGSAWFLEKLNSNQDLGKCLWGYYSQRMTTSTTLTRQNTRREFPVVN